MSSVKVEREPTYTDLVDRVFLDLFENERFRAFIAARSNDEAVEGSLTMDDFNATNMIRDRAKEMGIDLGGISKSADTLKALKQVMRRYNLSRKQRRA